MVVAFDADILILLLQPSIDPPIDPGTQRRVEYVPERLSRLVKDLTERDARVIVPAPALAEVLVVPGADGSELLEVIEKQAVFQIEPFRAADAVEAAASTRAALDRGDKKSGADAPWQCVKTDRQIVAVAKRCGAAKLYSNDAGMRKAAGDLPVVSVWGASRPSRRAEAAIQWGGCVTTLVLTGT